MGEQPFTFAWEVKNYNLYIHEAHGYLKSDLFVTDNLKDTEWRAFWLAKDINEEDFVAFYLERGGEFLDLTALHVTLQLIAADGTPGNEVTYKENMLIDSGFPFRKFASRRNLERFYLHNNTLKIQCVFWIKKEMETMTLFARTASDIRKFSKEWVLTNFSQVKHGILLEESVRLEEGGELLFDVCLSMEGKKMVIIQFTRRCVHPLNLNAMITLLDAQGRESEIWKQDQHVFDLQTPEEVWQFPTFISKAFLVRQKNKYLANDVLKLKCESTISSPKMASEIEDNSLTEETSDTLLVDRLTESMNFLYDQKLFADVELRGCKETVSANRIVLYSRSKKFAEMLDDVGVTDSPILDVPDVDIITLKRMLKFIYTDEIDDLEYDDAVLVYAAAHNYRIESLRCKYSFVLQSHLRVSNVCSVLQFADEFCDQSLKNCALDFIKQYHDRVDLSKECEGLSEKTQFLVKEVKEQLSRTFVVKHSTKY